MSPTKRFFLIFFLVYAVIAVTADVVWGPPGFSRAYLSQYKADQDRYLSIKKDIRYKLYAQRPELHPAEGELAGLVEFVRDYEARPEFRAEMRRRTILYYFFQFLNVGALIFIGVRFGRRPFVAFVDGQIEKLRARIQEAEAARIEAAKKKAAAQAKIDALPDETKALEAHTREVIHHEQEEIETATGQALHFIAEETENRKRLVEEHAAAQVKRELLEQAIDAFVARYREAVTTEGESPLVDQFARELADAARSRSGGHAS